MHTFLKFDKYKIIYALESFTACSLIYERQSNNRIRKFGPKQVGQMNPNPNNTYAKLGRTNKEYYQWYFPKWPIHTCKGDETELVQNFRSIPKLINNS